MTKEFECEHASIEEHNAPLGWGLKLVIFGLVLLSLAYGALFLRTDSVSRDGVETTTPHGRGDRL